MNDVLVEIEMLYKMILIRTFEEFIASKKMKNEIYGMVHCCIGQEAIAVGVCSALKKEDYIVCTHRPHGHAIAKGVDINKIMAELFEKSTGSNSGKGGSMHIHDKSCGLITSTGIVASGIPVACGAAFSSVYKKEERVTCVFLGDGAANEGVFYECLNLAKVWKLPIIFVIEDNGLAVTTVTKKTSCVDYIELANALGIESFNVDGQLVEEVNIATKIAKNYVMNNKQPCLLYAKTIRFHEHAEGQWYLRMKNAKYRDNENLNYQINEKCPIKIYCQELIKNKKMTNIQVLELYKKATSEVERSYKFALDSPKPILQSAFENVYI